MVVKSVILRRLCEQLHKLRPLQDQYPGFRKAIRDPLEREEATAVVFLDIANAFDSVWHQGLVLKIRKIVINHVIVRLRIRDWTL